MKKKSNIIFIFPDQHRGDLLGCVGHPVIKTPNLDKLAKTGVLFPRCFTNSPISMPARASLITGKYVSEHGVWSNAINPDAIEPSHVRNVRDAGYHTTIIGKTHLYTHMKEHGHTKNKKKY